MSTNIAVLLGLFRRSGLKFNKKNLENCGAFVIYLPNSTQNLRGFMAGSAVLISKQITNSSNYFNSFNFAGLSATW